MCQQTLFLLCKLAENLWPVSCFSTQRWVLMRKKAEKYQVKKRFKVRSSLIYSTPVQSLVVAFVDEYQPCWYICPQFRENGTLCNHFFVAINSGMVTFDDLSPIFRFHPLHVTDNDIFQNNLFHGANNTGEKDTSQIMLFLEDTFIAEKKSLNHS